MPEKKVSKLNCYTLFLEISSIRRCIITNLRVRIVAVVRTNKFVCRLDRFLFIIHKLYSIVVEIEKKIE